MKLVFSIEGNIGSGKSTLIEYLKKTVSDIIYLPEPVNVWNEIKDKNKYSFPFQMMAYISRLSLIKNTIKSAPDNCVILTERSIYTDREIFAKMLYDCGILDEICYSIYLKWFDEFSCINVDGIIYVKTTPEICLERINLRNRKGEESIPLEYLQECHNYHESWINKEKEKVLFIDGIPEQSEDLVLKVKEFILLKEFISLKQI
jgi:deoxyadenosine/deoxycytidine kinase